MRPHLGQGGCQGLEDAAILAYFVDATDDLAAAFARFAAFRRPRVRSLVRESKADRPDREPAAVRQRRGEPRDRPGAGGAAHPAPGLGCGPLGVRPADRPRHPARVRFALGPLLVDAADPAAAESFWAGALGPARAVGIWCPSARASAQDGEEPRAPRRLCPRHRATAGSRGQGAWRLLPAGHARRRRGQRVLRVRRPGGLTKVRRRSSSRCARTAPDRRSSRRGGRRWSAPRSATGRTERHDGCTDRPGWENLIWKFVRVDDARVVPNRWQWTLRADPSELIDPQGNEFSVVPPAMPSGLSNAVHIWRGLMKPNSPVRHRGASRRRGRHGGRGRHSGVVPHRGSGAAWAALRPGLEALGAQDVLGDPDLLRARGGRGAADTAVGGPGRRLELQAAVVAVAGVGGPVSARLALRDGVPVDASPRARWRSTWPSGRSRALRRSRRPTGRW